MFRGEIGNFNLPVVKVKKQISDFRGEKINRLNV